MQMILHLFKKDVRHSRVPLAIWLGLVALQCTLIGSNIHPGDLVWQGVYYGISFLVPLLEAIALVVIIPFVIQEDPLVGTTGFWFTRPISRSALLGAKALAGAIIIGLPLLAEVAVLAGNGVTGHDIALAVPEILLAGMASAMAIAVLAALTRSFGRFALAGAALLAANVLLGLGLFWVHMARNPEEMVSSAQNVPLLQSRMVIHWLLVSVGGGAVVVHQYLTRKTARSIAMALAVGLAALAATTYWPWAFLAPAPLPDTSAVFDPSSVKLSLGRTFLEDLSTLRGVGAPQKNFNAEIVALGLPRGIIVSTKRVVPRLSMPGGAPIAVTPPGHTFFQAWPDAAAVESALGGAQVVNPYYFVPNEGILKIDTDAYTRCAGLPLKLSADLVLVASKFVVIAEMPLVRGSRYDHGSEHAVITDVLHQGQDVEIVERRSSVQLLFSRTSKAIPSLQGGMLIPNPMPNSGVDSVYLLWNKKRNEAVLQKQEQNVDLSFLGGMAGRRLLQQTLRFSFGPEQNRLTPEMDDAWLADTELVRLDLVPVAQFEKHLDVENLKLATNYTIRPKSDQNAFDRAALTNLALPEQATPAQVSAYIESVLVASQRSHPFHTVTSQDPEINLLAKVGPENIRLLLRAAENVKSANGTYFLDEAIGRLARPEDKEAILGALAGETGLIDIVLKYGWQGDARDALMAVLGDENQRALPRGWIQAVASFKDPSTYPALKAYLVRCASKQQTYNAIRKLPGIDLAATVDAAWKSARYGQPYEILNASIMAGEFGHADVLDGLAKILKQDDGNEAQQARAATIFRRLTPATGDNASLIAWYDANHGHLVFDAKQKKFLSQPAQAN